MEVTSWREDIPHHVVLENVQTFERQQPGGQLFSTQRVRRVSQHSVLETVKTCGRRHPDRNSATSLNTSTHFETSLNTTCTTHVLEIPLKQIHVLGAATRQENISENKYDNTYLYMYTTQISHNIGQNRNERGRSLVISRGWGRWQAR